MVDSVGKKQTACRPWGWIQDRVAVASLVGKTPLVPIRRFAADLGLSETVEL